MNIKKHVPIALRYFFIALYLFIVLFPVYWFVTLSFRDLKDITQTSHLNRIENTSIETILK